MHLQVEVIREHDERGICDGCGVTDSSVLTTHIFAGTGNIKLGPWCFGCYAANGANHIKVQVEQADLNPGRRPPTKKDKRRSQELERKTAQRIKGKTQPGSGNQDHAKGDVRKKGVLRLEHKFTRAKQYTLKREELDKINGECSYGEKPVFQIDFLNPSSDRVEDSWVAIPYEDWKDKFDGSGEDS
jgi:hypothetical protein